MSWKGDPLERQIEAQRDAELRKRHQRINLECEIGALKARDEPPPDPIAQKLASKLIRAQGTLSLAFEGRGGFSDAIDYATEALQLDRRSTEALTIRALAHAQLDNFKDAVDDADAAIALDPDARSPFAARMRRDLPSWRLAALR